MFERLEVASPARPWTTALAFLVNATFITLGILVPMVKPDQLPAMSFRTVTPPYSVAMPERRAEPATQPSHGAGPLSDNAFRAPSVIPTTIDRTPDTQPPGPVGVNILGHSEFNAFPIVGLPLGPTPNPPALNLTPKPAPTKPLVLSHLDEGLLIRRIQPVYPAIAITTHMEGTVVLSALISTHGEIEHLQLVSGSPLLAQAALDAVKQWRYRPYILNGSPIEVQTQIVVKFNLQH